MAGNGPMGIFTRQDLDQLLKMEADLLELLPEFDQAEECGNDCQLLRQLVQEKLDQARAIKKHFMTPAPT